MDKKFSKALILVVAAATALSMASCTKKSKDKVVIKGSTTVLPITQKAAEEFRKVEDVSISIEGSGSGNGIKALLDSSCDIANASRAMKGKELEAAKEKGLEIKEITVAFDMIVPVVHPSNPVKNLTLTQLKAIYDGQVSNWKDLGGKDENIVIISRDTSSGTYEVWHELVMKKADVRKDALLLASNGAIVNSVSNNPKAIGYVGFGYLNNTIKPLNVDKVEPTLDNGKSGKYPVSRKLFMYVNEKTLKPSAKQFIDYILSAKGQAFVKEVGFIPVD